MKLGPVLLLNVVTVAIALVVYDHLRSEPAKDRNAPVRGSSASLERRVLELETRAPQTNDAILERLNRLEASRLGQRVTGGDTRSSTCTGK